MTLLQSTIHFLLSPQFCYAIGFLVVAVILADHRRRFFSPKDAPFLKLARSWLTGMPENYSQYMEYGYRTVR
jgi:biotin transporter BioY